MSSARTLDQLAAAVTDAARVALAHERPIEEPEVALEILERADALDGLLALAESPREWGFRPTPNAPPSIGVPLRGFLQRWISGADIGTLATEFLGVVSSRELAVEQIVDAVSELCEHFLSWTLGVVVATVNTHLAEDDPGVLVAGRTFRGPVAGPRLCENLAMYIRYGVDSAEAVELISAGLRSREFARRVAAVAHAREDEGEGLREWLQGLPMDRWRHTLDGTPADFLGLLEFTRTRGRGLLGALLADQRAEVRANVGDSIAGGPVAVRLIETDQPPQRFGVFRDAEMLGVVSPAAHADMTAVMDSGLEFDAEIVERSLILSLRAAAAGGE